MSNLVLAEWCEHDLACLSTVPLHVAGTATHSAEEQKSPKECKAARSETLILITFIQQWSRGVESLSLLLKRTVATH